LSFIIYLLILILKNINKQKIQKKLFI
jgi:hypothetical protein